VCVKYILICEITITVEIYQCAASLISI